MTNIVLHRVAVFVQLSSHLSIRKVTYKADTNIEPVNKKNMEKKKKTKR